MSIRFFADVTDIRFLSSVDTCVDFHVGQFCEAATTVWADERLHLFMHDHVPFEMGLDFEALAARLADKLAMLGVQCAMLTQAGLPAEGAPTAVADKRQLASLAKLMDSPVVKFQ